MITSMIFFPEAVFYEKPSDYGYDFEEVHFKTSDGISLFGWFLKAQNEKAVILFFHGNAGNISHRLYKVKGWLEKGFSVFMIDYRGYGKSAGKIESSENVLTDARAGLNWLSSNRKVPLQEIIFYGESLGSYPAIRLGAENKAGAVILEAPFTSFSELANVHYPMIPKMLLKGFEFENISYISELKCPVFFLHGMRDEICPYTMSGELFEKAPEPKGFLSVPNGMHNDLPVTAGNDHYEKPFEFLSKVLKP